MYIIADTFRDKGQRNPRICVATASVAKFREAVEAAQLPVPVDARVDELMARETRFVDWERDEDWVIALRDVITNISERRNKDKTAFI